MERFGGGSAIEKEGNRERERERKKEKEKELKKKANDTISKNTYAVYPSHSLININ